MLDYTHTFSFTDFNVYFSGEWVEAIQFVANKLKDTGPAQGVVSGDVEMGTEGMESDGKINNINTQGTSTGKNSGKRKVVCIVLMNCATKIDIF